MPKAQADGVWSAALYWKHENARYKKSGARQCIRSKIRRRMTVGESTRTRDRKETGT